ncbi:hypothetical protein ATV_gp12 [Bicaudavirus pozzuoliense]|uniref:Putative transmembrane protein ORF119 n=2 Tax=Acidianus two-tailed virus TaxID=315953 RepID=Y119_ATV|nr:hypothetical protein ATV_gp12 [Acidianus two-tailed virus]Q3V4S7.1 RecName: Full=Putative transmembrane protein ORF119 [Acidianus two-tailed virus]CAI59887.1 hypothetical protein [Acidianus two-tailed virus]
MGLAPSLATLAIALVFLGISLIFLVPAMVQGLYSIVSGVFSVASSVSNETGCPQSTEVVQLSNQTASISVPSQYAGIYTLYLSFISFVGSIFTDPIALIMLILVSLIITLFAFYYKNQG